ncbi:J domain-containing protein [Myxococcus sp. MxC21-1]|uniref:J domain-containing protein n=1 Tax=Myxococcus sp. MxC21-1 TaxID=3041439 RepID=UPI00292FC78B|nr:J domain-containing protein [Myxococcus sp. MxC21-1]WNZ65339.1 J domain-containing protein [Myxococcus sp. MxC21-1]
MKPFEQQTYYEILEVPVTAPKEEIRAAYERLTELYSPDSIAVYALVDEGQVDELRTRLAEALEILSDEELRAEYDKDLGLPARRLMDAVSTGGEVAHAASPVEARAGLVGVAASGAEDQTGHLSTQVPETGTNGRTGAVRDVPVEDSETAMTGQGGEGEAGAHATEPRVEPVPASSGHADFRASFFRGFSFAYVSSSLQDTQRLGSAVDVPVASIQPQVSGSGTGTGAASAESQREASGAVAAAPVGEPSAAHEAAAGALASWRPAQLLRFPQRGPR